MPHTLRTEIRQTRPFATLHAEAALNVQRTQAALEAAFQQTLDPFGISGAQYNVLRILRGAGADGLCRNEIRDRLVTRMPDVTRLLDRMEAAGLISRERSTSDRRMVNTLLTRRGRALVDSLDAPVSAAHRRQLGHMSEAQLRSLIDLLTLARTPA